jgi:hypothetical protein
MIGEQLAIDWQKLKFGQIDLRFTNKQADFIMN